MSAAPTDAIPTGRATLETEPSPRPVSPALAALLGETEAERFLRESVGRDAWRGRLQLDHAAALFGWERLNAALAQHRLAPPRLRLGGAPAGHGVFYGRRTQSGGSSSEVDVAALLSALRGGATLILDGAQELSPALQSLCAGLSADLTCFCQTNLYASWGETQGFDVHWDDHDVFVVQVEGRKRWRLYGPTREAPLIAGDRPDHVAPEDAREEIVLERGDLLYLPRGYWHAAQGVGEPTLHLTVGLTRRTGVSLVHWLADLVAEDAAFRVDLAFERGDAALAEQVARLLSRLAERDAESLGRAYRRHVESSLPQRPKLSLPAIGGAETALAAGDRLRLSDGASRIEPGSTDESLVLSWRGVRFTVAGVLAKPLHALVEGRTVSFDAFTRAVPDPQRAAEFVREMIGRGVFVLTPETRP